MPTKILFTLFVFLSLALWFTIELRGANTQYQRELVKECEAELPRNQHCEIVITAAVVREGE